MYGVRLFIKRLALAARRGTPTAWVPMVIRLRSILSWMRPELRQNAREQMRFVLGDDVSEEILAHKARAYVRRMTWRAESRWHPELVVHQPVHGLEHLESVLAAGTGAVVSFGHHGDDGRFASMRTSSVEFDTLWTPDAFKPGAPAWMRQQLELSMRGGRTRSVSGGSDMIRQLLAEGRLVPLAFDVPGSTPMRAFGRELQGASGALRIAYGMDVPIVMVTSHAQSSPYLCARVEIGPPVHPHDFGSLEELTEAVIAHHEAAILEWPEAYDEPMSRWTIPERSRSRGG